MWNEIQLTIWLLNNLPLKWYWLIDHLLRAVLTAADGRRTLAELIRIGVLHLVIAAASAFFAKVLVLQVLLLSEEVVLCH
jgi:hypothetical protein